MKTMNLIKIYLISVFVITFILTDAKACNLSIPESYIPTFLSPPISGHYEKCEDKPEEKCHCVDKINPFYSELADNEGIDYVAQRQYESCSDEADCDAKFLTLACDKGEAIKNYETLSVYCAVNVMKIDGKKLVESPSKKAAYEAAQASKKQLEAELAQVQKARDCGSRAINVFSLRNAKKGLSKAQRKQILLAYSAIKDMLDVGSLDNAKDAINEAPIDGVLITNQDKEAMIEAITSCN